MNKYLLIIPIAAMAVLATTQVSAYRGDPSQQGPNHTPERHEAMQEAFDNVDYKAWSQMMAGRGRVSQVINELNFSEFVRARKLAQEGKLDEAKEVRASLGLGMGGGKGRGQNCTR
jgi:hypothetical protein